MEREQEQSRTARRRKKKSKRWPWILLILFILITTAGISFAVFRLLAVSDKPKVEEMPPKQMMSLKDKMTIMVMGVDRRRDDDGRSDTLLVATIDPKKETAAVISVPRDTRVKISGHGYEKINHAFAYGGHRLSQRSVEGLLGVPMEHYILVDIHAFERIIDALGGVEIDVEKRMYYEDPWDDDGGLVIDLQPGLQHMDGETAIQYVRYRDEEGDIGRISRQQKFIRAVMEKMASPGIVLKLPVIVKEVSSAVETDLSLNDMVSLVSIVRDVQKKGVPMDMVPGKPAYIDEISYWLPDVVELRHMVARILDVPVDERLIETMQQEADEYEHSIPKEMIIVKDTKSIPARIRDNDNLRTDSGESRKNTDVKHKPDKTKPEEKADDEWAVSEPQEKELGTVPLPPKREEREHAAEPAEEKSAPAANEPAVKETPVANTTKPAAPNLSNRK